MSKELDNKLREILENLALNIGRQVTDSYKIKNGLYEGLSLNNVGSINQALSAIKDLMIEIIGEDEAIKKSITMTQIHNICERNTLRAELRSLIKGKS